MTTTDLWAENELLRQRLMEFKFQMETLKRQLEHERDERLKLKAENLWLKKFFAPQSMTG